MSTCIAFHGSTVRLASENTSGPSKSAVSGLPVTAYKKADLELLLVGNPSLVQHGQEHPVSDGFEGSFLEAFAESGNDCFAQIRGRFAIAVRNVQTSALTIAVDRFATIPLYLAWHKHEYHFAESIALLPTELRSTERLSQRSIFCYLYFHTIPSPLSIYSGISKLMPANFVHIDQGRPETGCYWIPKFDRPHPVSFGEQSLDLKAKLRNAVARYAERPGLGCFLSGGLDSSSVLGYLSDATATRARAFTIGFDAPEYDETEYARAAAKHFDAELNEYKVTPRDILAAISDISNSYDEPFGNSSAVPALCCARFAASRGVETLLAGDGGDELFAGNARYAKQKVFELYRHVPASIRRLLFDPLSKENTWFADLPGSRKLASYVRQANIPLPDRLESYNHLHRFDLQTVLTKRFMADIDARQPLHLLRERYWEPANATALDRMLYLDWKFTLSDNDLPKVSRMCQIAGVNVEFPYLNEDLVEFSTTIPSSRKLRGTYLRYFYRRSMKDFLPPAVLTKRKHGFGLPFGVWLVQNPELNDFVYKSLKRLQSRDIINPDFISTVREATEQEHAAYFGSMIWVLVMLEEWLATHH